MPITAPNLTDTQLTQPRLLAAAGLAVLLLLFWIVVARRRRRARAAGVPRGSVVVNVDPVRCARFGFCEHEAPDVFQIRREGRLTYRARVKVARVEPVIRAVEVCPARAISLGKLPRRYRR
jgi:ferredoxin